MSSGVSKSCGARPPRSRRLRAQLFRHIGRRGLELGDLAAELRVSVAAALDEPLAEGISQALALVGRVLALGVGLAHKVVQEIFPAKLANFQELGDWVGVVGSGVPKPLGDAFHERAAFNVPDPRRRRHMFLVDILRNARRRSPARRWRRGRRLGGAIRGALRHQPLLFEDLTAARRHLVERAFGCFAFPKASQTRFSL